MCHTILLPGTSEAQRSIFSATTKQVQGYATHPSLYHNFNGIWLT